MPRIGPGLLLSRRVAIALRHATPQSYTEFQHSLSASHSTRQLGSIRSLLAKTYATHSRKPLDFGTGVNSDDNARDNTRKQSRGFPKNRSEDSDSSDSDSDSDDDSSDPADWFGFDGDFDAVTDDGTPTWLASYRRMLDDHLKEEEQEKVDCEKSASAEPKIIRTRQVDESGRAYGTGRRKTSTARVWIKKSSTPFRGVVRVNKKDIVDYFVRDSNREEVLSPFVVVDQVGHFDVMCNVRGGGLSGQAGAIRHGISRALQNFDPSYRPLLKQEGYLTRDPRMVERKKPGQPKARKKYQWVKR
uniref:30S ribosomal protein S9 putative n=1 Tax=Albugo laibachii Nc14 TaxID=890382 RepID=F0W9K2_9STRA|nr:30S ribosomal protein S9 putative [Albugo laibachii Nc14]|eukprot:CCA17820.1 30S ribosomal protein S9 putative [Albugo laibachii Nc14]